MTDEEQQRAGRTGGPARVPFRVMGKTLVSVQKQGKMGGGDWEGKNKSQL